MFRTILPLIAMMLMLMSLPSVYAEEASYEIKGFGPRSCSDYYGLFQDGRINKEIRGWAYGFASALNVERQRNNQKPKNLMFLTGELVEQEILAYCPDKYDDADILSLMLRIYDSLPELD